MRKTLRHSLLTASLALALGGHTLIASSNEVTPSPRVLIEATGAGLDATALRAVGLADSRALRAREIGFDAQALGASGRAPRTGQRVFVSLFPGERVEIEGVRVEAGLGGFWTWVGKPVDDPLGEILLTLDAEGRLFGSAVIDDRTYQIQTARNGRLYAEELDPAAFPDGNDEVNLGSDRKSAASKTEPEGSTTVDVAVFYTSRAEARYDMAALINNAAASMNQSFVNSGATAGVRIVYYGPTSFDETAVDGGKITSGNVTDVLAKFASDSVYAGMRSIRDSTRADVVIVINDFTYNGDICGAGDTVGSPAGDEANAFSITGDTCIDASRTFSHEIGHVLGGYHDKSSYTLVPPSIYSYSFGFTNAPLEIRTIMGSKGTCTLSSCTRINYWSQPVDVGGVTIGNATTANMAAHHTNFIALPASYRTSGDPAPGTPGSLTITRGFCYGANEADWTAGSGTVGWYELQSATSSGYSDATEIYRGPLQGQSFDVSGTRHMRVRACNAEGCGGWRNGNQTATYYSGCL